MTVAVGSVWRQRDAEVEVTGLTDNGQVWVQQTSTGDKWRLATNSLLAYWRPVIPPGLFPRWQNVWVNPPHLGAMFEKREWCDRAGHAPGTRACVLRYELNDAGDVRVVREEA